MPIYLLNFHHHQLAYYSFILTLIWKTFKRNCKNYC